MSALQVVFFMIAIGLIAFAVAWFGGFVQETLALHARVRQLEDALANLEIGTRSSDTPATTE